MKVTLIQPRYFNIWESLSLAYIGAYLKREFRGKLEMDFFQGNFDDDQTIIAGAKDSDIIAFSCTSPTFKYSVHLAQAVKAVNPTVRSVFGGFHPSAVPQDCLEEEGVDQVVTGEGEVALLNILNGETSPLVKGEPFNDFPDIFPDRDLIKNQRTVDLCEQQIGQRITSFQSVRVCPFQCTFCAEKIVTGKFSRGSNPLRIRDPQHILEEIKQATRHYSLNYFKFADATWNTSAEKVISFCEEKIRQNFPLKWEANVHASLASQEMFQAMKAAGCEQINVGCESGSPKILRDQRKGLLVGRIKKVFQCAEEVGIGRRGYFLLGMPNETEEDIRLTEKLVEEIRPEVFGITLLTPYPGTAMYDPAKMKDYDWAFADEYSNPYWETKHFSNAELKQWQKYLTNKFSDRVAWKHKVLANQGDVDFTKLDITEKYTQAPCQG